MLSHALQEDDRELRPSALIAAVDTGQLEIQGHGDFRAAIHALRNVERLQDDKAPPLADGHLAGGGTGLLKDQAACPFRALARHRLQAEAPEVPHAGLDSLERGTLVHNVLAKVWAQLRSSDALQALGADALNVLLDAAADAAMERIRRERPTALSGRFADIEKRRLMNLARDWLNEDRRRSAFTVLAVNILGDGLRDTLDPKMAKRV